MMATVKGRPQSFSSPTKQKSLRGQTNEKDMWSTLLDSVSSGKRLPEKRLIILGGSSNAQRDILALLETDSPRNPSDHQKKRPPIANDFALGYTYQDVLDADHEDSLARLSIFTLQDSSTAFSPLLKPLLNPTTIPETLLVILLDWSQPWRWARQLRDWIRLLHKTLSSLDEESKTMMQEVMQDWEQRRRGGPHDMGGANASNETSVNVPLGSGEWDEALGLPLCVVCHNASHIDVLERENGWKEEEFDFILQFLRTILLKHGASLVYTSSSDPNSLPLLVQYSLGIHSILKRQPLKHNVVDRDKILIPPNWDSWGKIRVLRDGFQVEDISESWSLEIQPPNPAAPSPLVSDSEANFENDVVEPEDGRTLATYEETIKDPSLGKPKIELSSTSKGIEVETAKMQNFLADQSAIIERIKIEEDQGPRDFSKGGVSKVPPDSTDSSFTIEDTSRVKEHIGPVQFNMGGIQVDAEDMLNRIKERSSLDEDSQSPQHERESTEPPNVDSDGKRKPEQLATFFAGLIKKGGGSSAPGTPPSRAKTVPRQ